MAKCPREINDELYRDEWQWQEGEYTVTRNVQWTAPGCHNGCGVLHYTDKDGKLVKIEGDPKSPMYNGRLCMRCLVVPEVENHPLRKYNPMKRAKEDRGKDAWVEISWDEAYDIIAENYKEVVAKYGTKGVCVLQGTGRNTSWQSNALAFCSFQSPNSSFGFLSGESCYVPRISTMAMMCGAIQVMDCAQVLPEGYDDPRYQVPEVCVVWCCNPIVSNADGFLGHWIVDLMRRGTKLIVIDPRLTWMGAQAEILAQPRPGTDSALALAFMNIIIEEDLYDHEFVENWTYGFDELAERCKEYPVSKVAEITGLTEEKIYAIARRYATAKPAAIQWGLKVDQSKHGEATAQAIMSLWALTGNLDVPGGNIIVNTGYIQNDARAMFEDVCDKSERLGNETFPLRAMSITENASSDKLLTALEVGDPYPVKMLFEQSSNFISNMAADPQRCLKAALNCDFIAASDYYLTPTIMACADVFLPVAMSTERVGVRGWYNPLRTLNKIHETNARSDEQILLDIGHRLNPDTCPWADPEEFWNSVMANCKNVKIPPDFSYKKLQEEMYYWEPVEYKKYEKGLLRFDGQVGFQTPTGRFEFFSTILQAAGCDPLPYYEEPDPSPVSNPEYAAEYPLFLTTGRRSWEFFHSEHRHLKSMREFHRWPIVEMAPETAEKYGISEGDWVLIENKQGSCHEVCKINMSMHPNTIQAEHGWWYPERQDQKEAPNLFGVFEANVNQMVPMCDEGPSGFGAPYTTQMCRISKCEDYHPVYDPQY